MQPNPPLAPQNVQPARQEKQNPVFAILGTVFGVVLLCILLAGAAGLGYWAYTLNTQLTTTQQQLASLQSDYNALKSSNDKLTSDYAKSQSDLTTAQADLKKAQDQNKSQQANMDMASKKVKVIEAIFWNKQTDSAIESLVKATNDSQLLTKWNKLKLSTSQSNALDFGDYLFSSLYNNLK